MPRRDFTQDGSSDILWRQQSTGDTGLWDMDHGQARWVHFGVVGLDWRVAGTGDYARDGVADILWNHAGPVITISPVPPNQRSTDHVAWWDVSAATGPAYHDVMDYLSYINALVGRAFFTQVRQLPLQDRLDFNGDGRSDLLFATGGSGNNLTRVEIGLVGADGAVTLSQPNSWGWNFAAAADLTGDGTSDILWRQGAFGVGLWSFRDGQPVGWTDLGSTDIQPGFEVIATGDMTGDGAADLLWWNPGTRHFGIWDLDARAEAVTARWLEIGVVPGAWSLAAVGDYNGDGTEDLLWRDLVSGEAGFWAMRDGQIAGWQSLGIVPLDWQVT